MRGSRFLLVALVLVTTTLSINSTSAQQSSMPMPPLQLITAENAPLLREVARVGKGRLSRIAWSPEGKRLAASSEFGIWLYDFPFTGQVPKLFPGRTWSSNIAFSPDGRKFAAGDLSGSIAIWSIDTTTPQLTIPGEGGGSFSLAFSPDGRLLASTSSNSGIIWLWDAQTGKAQRILYTGESQLRQITFGPDATRLAVSSYAGAVQVWDVTNSRALVTHRLESASDPAIAYSPNGRYLAAGGGDTLVVLDAANGQPILNLSTTISTINSLAFSPDSKLLAAGLNDQRRAPIRVWEIPSGNALPNLPSVLGWVYSVAFSPTGAYLASVRSDGLLQIWSSPTLQLHSQLTDHSFYTGAIAFRNNHLLLFSTQPQTLPWLWDTTTGQSLGTLQFPRGFDIPFILFSRNGERMIIASSSGEYHIWNAQTQTVSTIPGTGLRATSAFLSPDSSLIAFATRDKRLVVRSTQTGEELLSLHTGLDMPILAAYSPDGSKLATSGSDGTTKIWNLRTGEQLHLFPGTAAVNMLEFSPDSRHLAISYNAGNSPGQIQIWDLSTAKSIQTFAISMDSFSAMAFSPDGKLLATAGPNQSIQVWDTNISQQPIATLPHFRLVSSLLFSQDGRQLASLTDNGTVRIWGVPAPSKP
jgi:WD40 repeat protein